MFKVILWGGCYYYPHLEGEKIDHKEFHYLAQDHTVRKWQNPAVWGETTEPGNQDAQVICHGDDFYPLEGILKVMPGLK